MVDDIQIGFIECTQMTYMYLNMVVNHVSDNIVLTKSTMV